jgi:hypothetical protein
MYNKFENQFYEYEKMKSRGNYKRNFWYTEIKSKLDAVSNSLIKGERNDDFEKELLIISNEIKKELAFTPKIKFEFKDDLTPQRIRPEIVTAAQNFVDLLRKYYIDYYNFADNKKNTLIEKLQKESNNIYLAQRNKHHNESLEEFATNKNETDTFVEFKGELIQKMGPIFMDPQYPFIKAHFYAPTKRIFGSYVDTYIVNVIVLWIMTFGLYLILYFRLLKRLLDSGEVLMGKKHKE